jgi:hypothetical protein
MFMKQNSSLNPVIHKCENLFESTETSGSHAKLSKPDSRISGLFPLIKSQTQSYGVT